MPPQSPTQPDPSPTQLTTDPTLPDNHHPMITRSKDGIYCPNRKYLFHCESIPKEPKSVKSMLCHPGWEQAMEAKLQTLIDQQSFQLVPRTPDMRVQWVWKTKLNSNGTLEKLKARYVAKGFN